MRKIAEVMCKIAETMCKIAEVMRKIADVMRKIADVMRKNMKLLADLTKQKEIIICCLQIFQLYSAESFDDDDGEYHFLL